MGNLALIKVKIFPLPCPQNFACDLSKFIAGNKREFLTNLLLLTPNYDYIFFLTVIKRKICMNLCINLKLAVEAKSSSLFTYEITFAILILLFYELIWIVSV